MIKKPKPIVVGLPDNNRFIHKMDFNACDCQYLPPELAVEKFLKCFSTILLIASIPIGI